MHGRGLAGVIIFQLTTPSVGLPCHGRLLGKELDLGQWQRLAITLLCCYKSSTYKVSNPARHATRHVASGLVSQRKGHRVVTLPTK
jgi:hypothetical protein